MKIILRIDDILLARTLTEEQAKSIEPELKALIAQLQFEH